MESTIQYLPPSGLRRIILLHPGADLPRHCFSALLRHKGETTVADFIEAQLEGKTASPPEIVERRWRTRRWIDDKRRRGWTCCERDADRSSCSCMSEAPGFSWFRGFVSALRCKADWFEKNATELFSNFPIVDVEISELQPTEEYGRGWSFPSSSQPDFPEELAPPSPGGRPFPTRRAAMAAASEHLVGIGRKRVGLPTLWRKP